MPSIPANHRRAGWLCQNCKRLDGNAKYLVYVWIMKLLEQVDLVCRRMGLARATAKAYKLWIANYLRFVAARFLKPETCVYFFPNSSQVFPNHSMLFAMFPTSSVPCPISYSILNVIFFVAPPMCPAFVCR